MSQKLKWERLAIVAIAAMGLAATQLTSSCAKVHGTDNTLKVDSVKIDRSYSLPTKKDGDPLNGVSHFSAVIDFPSTDQTNLGNVADSVMTWFSTVILPDSQRVATRQMLEFASNNFLGGSCGNDYGRQCSIEIRKTYEDERYVTFEYCSVTNSGDERSDIALRGATFEKSNGHRLTWENFDRTDDLRRKITHEIREQHGAIDDVYFHSILTVADSIIMQPDGKILLPLPKADPWMTKAGWSFAYQPLEILPSSDGVPSCCVSEASTQMD